MDKSNIAALTQSHRAIASKKRARREQIKEIVFDDEVRREFLTGFHKRKLQKKEDSKKKREEREKQERLEMRRENRRTLAERAAQNAAEVEAAYGAVGEDAEEWAGVAPSADKGKRKARELEEEYEDEEQVATVTVVEDFDPETLIYGPSAVAPAAGSPSSSRAASPAAPPRTREPARAEKKPQTAAPGGKEVRKAAPSKAGTKTKKVRYQTVAARKSDKRKQLARRTEKAERAGGKQRGRAGAGKRR